MTRALQSSDIGALVALVNQDRLVEAEDKARELLSRYPNAGMLWKILGVALLRQSKDALPALRRTVELIPDDAEAHGNLGSALHDRGQWAAALESLSRALAGRPNDVELLVNAANSLRGLDRAAESITLYERALQLEPRHIEAQNNLGNAFLELKDHTAAAAAYRRALELDPNSSVTHHNLGLVFSALGRREEAVASFGRALSLKPRDCDALNNLGNVFREMGRLRQAESLYASAIVIDAARPDSHFNLGSVLFELRQIEAAAECFRTALRLRPDYVLAHVGLATALRQQRRADEAEASCKAALDVNPRCIEALSLLGELQADRGLFSAAEATFRQAIVIQPDYPAPWCSIAAHRRMTEHDSDWLEAVRSLLQKRQSLGHAISLHYALGKYFDDVGDYAEAFARYRDANELTKRYGSRYDAAKFTSRVDEMIAGFDSESIRRLQQQGSSSELPVFIIGMPRSGTSLMEQILASHPDVLGAGELTFWHGAFATYRTAPANGEVIHSIALDYLAILPPADAKIRIIDKLPANFMYAGLIHAVFPNARIIHMRRHPIDTCLSMYFQNFFNMGPYANNLENLAHYYREYLRLMRHWQTVIPATCLMEVSYETLLGDQERCTRRILEFMGLPWAPACLEFHRTERVVLTASKWQVRQKIHSGSVGRWKNYEKYVGPLTSLLEL
jgi:tetratricopeptide (TPR) repeat protein